MSKKSPPSKLTALVFERCQKIAFALGHLEGSKLDSSPIKLRRENQVKTIQSSLAIEGNQLTIEQVTGLLEGKRIIGPKHDILEVTNAIKVYSNLAKWKPLSLKSFKEAHKMLMEGLIPENGQWRTKGIGIFKGKEVAHIPPSAGRVPSLMEDLFLFINKDNQFPWLIKACVFHYELEFIHPFSDGNGRIGRLWQQVLLMKEHPAFQYISVESIIKANQSEYYSVLAECDSKGDSTLFLEFSLEQILAALNDYLKKSVINKKMDLESRLSYAKAKLQVSWFSRKEYLMIHKDISTATASRDLEQGIELGKLKKSGQKKLTTYRYIDGK